MKYYVLIIMILDVMALCELNYKRSTWRHWIDIDKDCQDTRQEVLISESLIPVTLDDKGCKVLSGRWFCSYTGKYYTNPSLLDIDHLIPLKHAHEMGACQWDKETKKLYANDLYDTKSLIAVYRGANRQKGARPPHKWMPAFKEYWCSYIEDWVSIKQKWNLNVTTDEKQFILGILNDCLK